MSKKIAMIFGTVYPYVWPVAFIVMGVIALNSPHMQFTIFDTTITGHALMWFMMGLAHADIFWRGWCTRHNRPAPYPNRISNPAPSIDPFKSEIDTRTSS